jgi:hypothetical protein
MTSGISDPRIDLSVAVSAMNRLLETSSARAADKVHVKDGVRRFSACANGALREPGAF